jgi:hypothetical protein
VLKTDRQRERERERESCDARKARGRYRARFSLRTVSDRPLLITNCWLLIVASPINHHPLPYLSPRVSITRVEIYIVTRVNRESANRSSCLRKQTHARFTWKIGVIN